MNYILKTNNGHRYAATHVKSYNNGREELVSYTTTVIIITPEGWLSCTGLYSRTTIKHIGWFMRERGMDYYLAKALYMDNKEYNIHTGEIRNRE